MSAVPARATPFHRASLRARRSQCAYGRTYWGSCTNTTYRSCADVSDVTRQSDARSVPSTSSNMASARATASPSPTPDQAAPPAPRARARTSRRTAFARAAAPARAAGAAPATKALTCDGGAGAPKCHSTLRCHAPASAARRRRPAEHAAPAARGSELHARTHGQSQRDTHRQQSQL